MGNKLVSIIIPVFNAEEFIENTIKNILLQNYSLIEVILVDDGSTDRSAEIILNYQEKDSRLIYLRQDNQGPSAARNNGLRKATGDYVLFVDADDSLKVNALRDMINESNDSDLLIFGYENVNEENAENNQVVIPSKNETFTLSKFLPLFSEFLEKNILHYVWNKLYRKEVLREVYFDETVKVGEDLLFNIEVLKNVSRLKCTESVYYNHIWFNDNSITLKYHESLFDYRNKQYISAKEFLKYYQSYNDKNITKLKRYYLNKYIACFFNLESPSATMTRVEKNNQIQIIVNEINDEGINEYYNNLPIWQVMYVFLIRHKSVYGIKTLTKVLLPIQKIKRK